MNTIIKQIDPFTLPSVSLEQRDKLPKIAAVYFAISDAKEILYIGRAVCLNSRWISHHRMRNIALFNGARIAWHSPGVVHSAQELAILEKACIKHFKPKLNHTVIPEEVSGTPGVRIQIPAGIQRHLLDISVKTGMDIQTSLVMAVERFGADIK
jgi:hypothetical protein